MLASAVIQTAREILQDETTPYRYSAERLQRAYDMGLNQALRLRPDLFVAASFLPSYYSGAPSQEFPLDGRFQLEFVYYIVSLIESEKDGPQFDQRSQEALNRFKMALVAL
jgi:hypothetical protein